MRSARRAWARDLRCTSALLAVGVLAGGGCGSVRSDSTPATAGSSSASTAAPAAPASKARGSSGIIGRAVVTVCAGADAGSQGCPLRPVLATIDVLQPSSQHRVASVRASRAGWFRIVLPPGSYQVRAHAAGVLLWARAIPTQVVAHHFARLTLRLIVRHPLPVGAPS
jgi:hypothetical protein